MPTSIGVTRLASGTVTGYLVGRKADVQSTNATYTYDDDRNATEAFSSTNPRDGDPDTFEMGGAVTFSPTVRHLTWTPEGGKPQMIHLADVVCSFDARGTLVGPDGEENVVLTATDAPGITPTGWGWKVSFGNFRDAGGALVAGADPDRDSFVFSLPAGSTVDLAVAEAAAGAAANPKYVVVDSTTAQRAEAAAGSAEESAASAAESAKRASEAATQGLFSTPTWDASAGCYDNASVRAWLSTMRDGREYGVRIPLTASTTLTKLGANAGMAVPTLSVGSVAGIDPYRGVGPFFYEEANGYVDPDGTPHVTAIRGGEAFSRTDADVFVLAPVLYVKYVTNADTMEIWVSDTWHPGYKLQPHATLPDGTARPYMLYAKYPLGYVESGGSGAGHAASRSGLQPWTNSATNASGAASTAVSHDGLISIMATATTGYSGRSVADDWYLKVMFWLKYATKNSQAYFPQCSGYSLSYPVTVAESNAPRVIISKENAANLVVGSSVLVGTDQNAPQDHRIKSIGTYDSENSAVYLYGATVSPTTGMKVFTKPWFSGCCDAVEGDGVLGSGGKYPCVLQGIEFGHGMREIVGDVIVSSDGGTGWHPYVCHDSAKEARSVTSDYVRCAKTLPSDSADGWHYPLAPDATDEGLIFGSTSGGGTSTGLCDGSYTHKESAAGTREWQALGYLADGARAGLCYVSAGVGLDGTWWFIGSRLSATGRSRG